LDRTQGQAIAVDLYNQSVSDTNQTLSSSATDASHQGAVIVPKVSMAVRRLTPVECERLQGFPDNFTRIPWRNKPATECPDGPRYKALGNSMAVPVMRWIGERIQQFEDLNPNSLTN
jgi:DNA (cytosine-5)-methyltransferase 1